MHMIIYAYDLSSRLVYLGLNKSIQTSWVATDFEDQTVTPNKRSKILSKPGSHPMTPMTLVGA